MYKRNVKHTDVCVGDTITVTSTFADGTQGTITGTVKSVEFDSLISKYGVCLYNSNLISTATRIIDIVSRKAKYSKGDIIMDEDDRLWMKIESDGWTLLTPDNLNLEDPVFFTDYQMFEELFSYYNFTPVNITRA